MSKFLKRNCQHLKEVDKLLEEESGSPKRHALRETTSRLNRPLPMQQLLQALPEQPDESEDCIYADTFDRPTGLSEDTSSAGSSYNDTHGHSSVMFGFQTPSKRRGRQSLLEIAITSSAQKKQQQQLNNVSPPQSKTTQKSELEKTPTRHASKRTPQKTPRHKTPSRRRGSSDVSPPVTPLTPALSRATLLTPKCVPRTANESCANTPRSRRSLVPQLQVEEPATPGSFRRKVKARIQEVAYDSDSDEDVSDVSSLGLDDSVEDKTYAPDVTKSSTNDSDSQEDDEGLRRPDPHTLSKATRLTQASSVKKTGRKKRARHDEEEDKADQVTKDYFLHNAVASSVSTSDHTLGRLAVPRLRTDALHSLMAKATLDHRQEREDLFEEHCGVFEEWMTMLGYGYSIGVHGVGSKKSLLTRFQQECLGDCDHIVVNGFFPSLTVKSILSCIIEEVLCLQSPPATPAEQLQLLRRHYGGRSCSPLYLLLHNIDGPMLRTSASQHTLSLLCSLPGVRLVASVDHVNAPLLLDSRRSAEYNLLWYDCTTFAQYLEETSYENSLLVQQSASLALSSLVHVFKSLTPSAKGVFLLLAEYQLQHKQDGSYTGLSFTELYHRCRERLLVNSELTLRAQLTEFLDHRLVRNKKGPDGGECLVVPLEEEALRNFVEEEGKNVEE